MEKLKGALPPLLTGLAAALVILALGRSLFLFLDYMQRLIAFPFNVDYGEGPVLDQALRLAQFQSIYPRDLSQLPFTIGNYPPLYHILQLPFAWLFGPAFWYGRVINLLSILVTAVLIGLTIQTLTRNHLAGLVGMLLLPALPYILHWAGFVRVDSLALAASWGGLYAVVRWPEMRKGLLIAALCLTAAIFTRQSYGLAAPLAAFVWLLSQKPRRKAFELAIWTGGLSVALFILFNVLTGGGFYFNLVTANVNPFFWETVRNYAVGIWDHAKFLVILCGIYLVGGVWSGYRAFSLGGTSTEPLAEATHGRAWWLAAPYLLASTASAVTIGKDGSNVNYLFELSAALSLTSGLLLAWLGQTWVGPGWRNQQWVGRRWWLVTAGLILLAYQVNGLYDWNRDDYYRWPTERVIYEAEQIAEMARRVREADGPVLADEFMGLVPLSGKHLVFQPFEFKQLVTSGVWDETTFINAIHERLFVLILLYDPPTWDSQRARWTPAQLHAIQSNYRLAGRLANTQVYVPLEE
jgi:4-amino-4-deoxy-L-arabinose transferase-like glycosyltransferase